MEYSRGLLKEKEDSIGRAEAEREKSLGCELKKLLNKEQNVRPGTKLNVTQQSHGNKGMSHSNTQVNECGDGETVQCLVFSSLI